MDRRLDDIYKALADAHRRAIVRALAQGPCHAGRLGEYAGLAPNALTFHLNRLRAAGLVEPERRGRFRWYRLNSEALEAWAQQAGELRAVEGGRPKAETRAGSARQQQKRTRRAVAEKTAPPTRTPATTAPEPEPRTYGADEVLPDELL